MVFDQPCIRTKILHIEEACHRALLVPETFAIPSAPARDVPVVSVAQRTAVLKSTSSKGGRQGLASSHSQLHLLHDLANIELQAMELALRTIVEFPHAPPLFREELAQIAIEESQHLQLCLQAMESMGGGWGDCDVHLGLWSAVSHFDHLLERVFIVHRYLESSGLDAGEGLLRRLSGVADKRISNVVKKIVDDEIDHVEFGSRWYFSLCQQEAMDPFDFYKQATQLMVKTHPRKESASFLLRKKAGYEDREIVYLQEQKNLQRSYR